MAFTKTIILSFASVALLLSCKERPTAARSRNADNVLNGFSTLEALVNEHKPRSVEQFLEALKKENPSFFSNFGLVWDSKSLQESYPPSPRVVMHSLDSTSFVSFNGAFVSPLDNKQVIHPVGVDQIEVFDFDASRKDFNLYKIDFCGGKSSVEVPGSTPLPCPIIAGPGRNEALLHQCYECHQHESLSQHKNISVKVGRINAKLANEEIYLSQLKRLASTKERNSLHYRYSLLDFGSIKPMGPDAMERENNEVLNMRLGRFDRQARLAALKRVAGEDFPKIKFAVFGALIGCDVAQSSESSAWFPPGFKVQGQELFAVDVDKKDENVSFAFADNEISNLQEKFGELEYVPVSEKALAKVEAFRDLQLKSFRSLAYIFSFALQRGEPARKGLFRVAGISPSQFNLGSHPGFSAQVIADLLSRDDEDLAAYREEILHFSGPRASACNELRDRSIANFNK